MRQTSNAFKCQSVLEIEQRQVRLKEEIFKKALETQGTLFKQRRFLAMPLAGMLVWSIIGIMAPFVSELVKVYSVWLGCGSIFILLLVSQNLLAKIFLPNIGQKTPLTVFVLAAY